MDFARIASGGSLSAREKAMQLLEQQRFREMLPKRWILNIWALMDMSDCEREGTHVH